MAQYDPSRLCWVDNPVCFDSSDLPENNKRPGRYPLLVAPIIDTVHVHRVLVDGRSSFSIITNKTLDRMHVSHDRIRPTSRPFYGILQGTAHGQVGQIVFPVIFGEGENYRRDLCTFE